MGGRAMATAALAACLVGASLLAGCGGPDTVLDRAATEAEVGRVLQEAHPDIQVSQVGCPDDLEVEPGGRFRCGARFDGVVVEVDVRQGEQAGHLEVRPRSAVVTREGVEEQLLAALGDRLASDSPEVACPGAAVKVVEPGTAAATWTCTVTDGRTRRPVEVTVRDASGSLSFELR